MKKSSIKKSRVLIISLILLFAVFMALVLIIRVPYMESFNKASEQFRSIKVGMTEDEVLNRLGTPEKVYNKATALKDYYIKGYAHKKREISNKVLIYTYGEAIAYIYLDEEDKVEDVFIGGS